MYYISVKLSIVCHFNTNLIKINIYQRQRRCSVKLYILALLCDTYLVVKKNFTTFSTQKLQNTGACTYLRAFEVIFFGRTLHLSITRYYAHALPCSHVVLFMS